MRTQRAAGNACQRQLALLRPHLPYNVRRALALWPVVLGTLACPTSWADDYHLGQGGSVGDFLVSGYANLIAEAPRGAPAKASVDDLSLFAAGRINRWVNPFFEVEITSATVAQEGGGPRNKGYFVPERLYNDAQLSEADVLRVGKLLSPVGDWNLVHAAPLVPTTTRPLTTYRGFSEYANGVSWLHETPSGAGPDWQLYWQPGNEWFPRPEAIAPRHYRDVFGAHASWPLGFVDKVGLSLQHGRMTKTDETYTLLGANARRSFGRLSLEGEAVTSRWSGTAPRAHDHEWGGYGLADYAFTSRWHGLLEWERYQDHQVNLPSRNTLLGFAYKPEAAIVWKFEYVHQAGVSADIPTGWLASFSALF